MKGFCLSLLVLAATPVAAAFTLGPPERLVLQYTFASHVAVGDFNGDGRDDLAAAIWAFPDYNLNVFLQRADGTLAPPLVHKLPEVWNADSGYALAAIDVDGDGIDELATGATNPGFELVRYDGTAQLVRQRIEGTHGCESITSGDIDGDGHADIACHDPQLTATFYYGDGTGSFAPRTMRTSFGWYLSGPVTFKNIRLADMTGDGRPDFIGTDSVINNVFVYENDGRRGFHPARAYPQPWAGAARAWAPTVVAMDLGGDGVQELVTTSPGNGAQAQLNVHRRQPNGFLQRTDRVQAYDSPTALQVADMDGDGLDDVVVAHYGFNAASVALQRDGQLVHTTHFDLPGFRSHAHSLAVGDLDSDGCMDVVAGTHSGVFLLRGCRDARRSLPRHDFDGDGVADLIIRLSEFSLGRIYPWALADYHWYDPNGLKMPYLTPNSEVQAWGDFDGDGNSDLFLRDRNTGENNFLMAAQRRLQAPAIAGRAWQVHGSGDFNGDDRSDLVWRNAVTGENLAWPSGRREASYRMDPLDVRWVLAGIGDFDDDGRSDILWRHSDGRNMVWYAGSKALGKALPSAGPAWIVAGIGDLDGDHRDDVVWRHAAQGRTLAWRGANAGQQIALAPLDERWSVQIVADYNGDGLDDLLWLRDESAMEIRFSGQPGGVRVLEPKQPYEVIVR